MGAAMPASSIREDIEKANTTAVERMMDADPLWVEVGLASQLIPQMKDHMLLHAGPPIEWDRMSGPMKGAVIGAILYEGWANDEREAEKLAASGRIQFAPNHHHNAVGPMAGVISPSMPVFSVYDRANDNYTFSNLNEGIGKVLRYGAYDQEVLTRLRWMKATLAAVLEATIKAIRKDKEGVSIKPIIAQALGMGDECHNRYVAATTLFLKEVSPYLFTSGFDQRTLLEAYNFMARNHFTLLNVGMAAAKAMTLAAHKIRFSTIVTVMTRNGTDTGIWVSGLNDEWFTEEAPIPKGVWFPGYSEQDANPDLGDSSITETAGFGGFAMAAAPGIVSWVGGSVAYAVENTKRMYEITYTKHKYFTIPFLDFQGTPTGIDLRKVVKTGITPTINTGIAHRQAGIGQVGAGLVTFPLGMFRKALKAYAERYGL